MNEELSHRIRARAYELWETQPQSSDLDNWLAAEREILHGSNSAATTKSISRQKSRPPRRKAH